MIQLKKMLCVILLLILAACNSEQDLKIYYFSYPFSKLDQDWTGGFADYPLDSVGYQLHFRHDTLTTNLNAKGTIKGLLISGNNFSDDLFMFVRKRVSGLQPGTTYELLFNVRLASASPTNTTDLENAPGEGVKLKVGASVIEPEAVLNDDGDYRMNIDKGDGAEGGADMIVIGNIAVAANTTTYTSITRSNSLKNSITATTDENGALWIIVGTDSGYIGNTKIYYTQIDVMFNQVE